MILRSLLEAIARENGIPESRAPRPCDVFDTIVGIGAGGWLAILLGRFRMTIDSCHYEWGHIMGFIAPKTKAQEIRQQLLQRGHFDKERLVQGVNFVTEKFDTGDYLFEPDIKGARTCHVLVAAQTSEAQDYNLFRSYEIPKSAKLPEKLLKGPANPSSFKISSAFGVTGAPRYFKNAWREQMTGRGPNTKFPKPYNITELALDEIWGIYGNDVPISIVVNIGPGNPSDVDVKQIARRFSWSLRGHSAHEETSIETARSPVIPMPQLDEVEQDVKPLLDSAQEGTAEHNGSMKVAVGDGCERSVVRNLFGRIRDKGVDAKSRDLQDDIEQRIKTKLNNNCSGSAELYCRITHSPDDL